MFYRALSGPVFGDPVKNGGSGVRIPGNGRFYDVFDVPCQPGVEGGVRGFPWVLRGPRRASPESVSDPCGKTRGICVPVRQSAIKMHRIDAAVRVLPEP